MNNTNRVNEMPQKRYKTCQMKLAEKETAISANAHASYNSCASMCEKPCCSCESTSKAPFSNIPDLKSFKILSLWNSIFDSHKNACSKYCLYDQQNLKISLLYLKAFLSYGRKYNDRGDCKCCDF